MPVLNIASIKLTPRIGYEKLLQTLLQTSDKKIRVDDFSGQKLGRVGKPEIQGYFFGRRETSNHGFTYVLSSTHLSRQNSLSRF
jgi:hypothetical protein